MAGKMKFNPVISRVKLNPEQAVLQCTCYRGRYLTKVSANRSNQCAGLSVRTLSSSCNSAASTNTT